jgi:acid stress-induced BolA-like protein IbaG/YrbA
MHPEVEVIGEIADIEIIAVGRSIRELNRLQKMYGMAGRFKVKPHS